MSEFKNQLLFIALMAAGGAITTGGTMKPSYQNATVSSCMQDDCTSDDSDFKDHSHHPIKNI